MSWLHEHVADMIAESQFDAVVAHGCGCPVCTRAAFRGGPLCDKDVMARQRVSDHRRREREAETANVDLRKRGGDHGE